MGLNRIANQLFEGITFGLKITFVSYEWQQKKQKSK